MIRLIPVLILCAFMAMSAVDAQTKLYWSDLAKKKSRGIYSSNLDGTQQLRIVKNKKQLPETKELNGHHSIAIDQIKGKLYWVDPGAGKIYQANTDGTNAKAIVKKVKDAERSSIDLDPALNLMFWSTDKKIISANLKGKGQSVVLEIKDKKKKKKNTAEDTFKSLIVDRINRQIYFVLERKQKKKIITFIQKANYDGSSRKTIMQYASMEVDSLAIDEINDRLYWVDLTLGLIRHSDLNGKDRKVLTAIGSQKSVAMTLDPFNAKLYWTDRASAIIHRVDLDSETDDLMISSPVPMGADIDVPFPNRLTLLPEADEINPLIDAEFDVDINLNGERTKVAKLDVNFDPDLVSIVDSRLGPYFDLSNSIVMGPVIDNQQGIWSLEVISNELVTDNSQLAVLTFEAVNTSAIADINTDVALHGSGNEELPVIVLDTQVEIDNGIFGGNSSITGNLLLADLNDVNDVSAKLILLDTGAEISLIPDLNGNLQVNGLVDGNYNLIINADYRLPYIAEFNLLSNVQDLSDIYLISGDLDNNNIVESNDFDIMKSAFGASEGTSEYLELADLVSEDKQVNIYDLAVLAAAYNRASSNL